eukprot:4060309-Prymnesium_polylepis.1
MPDLRAVALLTHCSRHIRVHIAMSARAEPPLRVSAGRLFRGFRDVRPGRAHTHTAYDSNVHQYQPRYQHMDPHAGSAVTQF